MSEHLLPAALFEQLLIDESHQYNIRRFLPSLALFSDALGQFLIYGEFFPEYLLVYMPYLSAFGGYPPYGDIILQGIFCVKIIYNQGMVTQNLEKEYHVSRYIIVYKFILGLFEVILGFGIIIFGKKIYELYLNFRNSELLEDPHDLLAKATEKFIPFLLAHQGYVVFILLLLGITKMVGSVGLWYRKHWGLDVLIVVTIALLPFEIYAILAHPSLTKTAYFIINLFIALYLVNFNPKGYFTNLKERIKI